MKGTLGLIRDRANQSGQVESAGINRNMPNALIHLHLTLEAPHALVIGQVTVEDAAVFRSGKAVSFVSLRRSLATGSAVVTGPALVGNGPGRPPISSTTYQWVRGVAPGRTTILSS